jgi:hypothetical protein
MRPGAEILTLAHIRLGFRQNAGCDAEYWKHPDRGAAWSADSIYQCGLITQ